MLAHLFHSVATFASPFFDVGPGPLDLLVLVPVVVDLLVRPTPSSAVNISARDAIAAKVSDQKITIPLGGAFNDKCLVHPVCVCTCGVRGVRGIISTLVS